MPPVHHVAGPEEIRSIPIDRIRILNPRSRSKKVFAGIVENIARVGLKRPITVTHADNDSDGPIYHLVCGQGRIEAFQALGEKEIPASVVTVSEADLYLMSLVENLARRQHSSRDLLHAVRILDDRGYSATKIAEKIGLDRAYIRCILTLLTAGEHRLITAVEQGWLPIYIAAEIAKAGEQDVQTALMQAYENGSLRGEQFMRVRQLIDRRRTLGKGYGHGGNTIPKELTAKKLLQTYQTEVRRQTLMVKKAEASEQRLVFVLSALRKLLADDHFRTLLRAEGINDMPKTLADRLPTEAHP
jgi:ParB family transcriptional regulator, chromosome partitioning protein